LNAAAGLTTTADQFTGGCASSGVGLASNTLIYLGLTSSGVRVGALAAYDSTTQQNAIFVLLTAADGTMKGTSTLAAPASGATNPVSLLSADLNHDGTNDLVSVNGAGSSSGTVSITAYLGNPDGSFKAGQTFTLPGTSALGGVIDDFNGDGNLDVVVPSTTAGNPAIRQVTYLPGKGDGTFGAAKTTTVTSAVAQADGVVSGDFNGDSKKDLVSGYGLVLLGNGDGTFTAQAKAAFATLTTTFSAPPPMATGDFNGDGKLDVAAGTGSSIVVVPGNGDGTFGIAAVYSGITNNGYLTATDLDGDGKS
jgi:hypothetical protein